MTGLYVASQSQSLSAQHQLQRNMGDLSNILMRLSTGLRINSGKDDPAGLIASELLKSDITATSKAITNAQRANSVISIADSSLGQVSSLLTDIKALIVEAANSGAMNAEQIKANQLQVDASLDSIDRISKTTNYQGQLLLDGSMDFQTQGLSNAAVKDLKVHQANFGTLSQVDVGINIQSNADYGKLYYDKGGISTESVIEIGGNLGSDVFRFQAGTSVTDIAAQVNKVSDSTGVKAVVGADATNGQILITSAGFDNDINLRALTAGAAAGNYTIKYTAGNSNETTYKITEPSAGQPGIIDFQLKMQPKAAPAHSALDESFNGIYTYDITGNSTGAGIVVQTTGTVIRQTEFVQYTGTPPAGSPLVSATFDKASGNLQIHYAAGATNADVERAVNSIKGFKLLSGGAAELVTQTGAKSPADLRANNALDFTATVNGTKFENTDIVYYNGTSTGNDVDLEYKAYAQQAAATIRWGGATAAAGDVQLRISGKEASSSLNDVTIEFEQDNTFDAGDVSAVYDAERKILHIRGQIDNTDTTKNASYGTLKAAIEKASPFRADITEYNTATQKYDIAHELSKKVDTGLVTGTGLAAGSATTSNVVDNSYIKTGQVYGDIGTDHQALFIRVKDATITANDVVAAFNNPANAAISANFSVMPSIDNNGTGTIFSASWDTNVTTRVFSKALTGGKNGYVTDVTAKELTEFINNDAVLSKMFAADVALGQYGSGYLTLFDEAAYYGDPNAETSLQFLGPQGSPDVMFVTDGPSSPLYITFEPRLTSDMPAGLLATNPNAAFTVSALKAGEEYNNMAVRLIRLDNNHSKDDSYIQYKAGPSNAMAYCSIVESGSATSTETGKFIVYGKDGGTALNNVSVVAKLDKNQAERVKAVYDENTKQLIVTVNSDASSGADAITLTEAVAAINDFTPFKAEYDYSFNQETGNTGPGSANFSSVFASGPTIEIGNTGNTGGYNGILEVYVGGDDDEITAQNVIDAINNDEIYRNLFAAQTLGAGAGAGTGLINFRSDNLRKSPNEYGQSVAEMNMVTGLQGQSYDDPGYMVVHLATDQYGSSITTAADLVNFMNSLTAEETKGISVSLVRPAGLDNLLRTWTIDSCGNVIETQACEDGYGKGLLQPTLEIDDCGVVTNYPIEFFSYGENLVPGKAYGSIVAVNGINASLRIAAKNAGSEFNAVGFRYVLLTDPDEAMYTEYDAGKKEISVYIHDGITASQVKSLIDNSPGTRELFTAEILGDGTGLVTTADDYMLLKNGIYDAGYRGGAKLLGAADADAHRLIFESAQEGSSQRVTVRTISGDFYVRNESGQTVDTAYGKDMVATLNGIKMKADGRALSLDTSVLKLDITFDEIVKAGDRIQFSLTGGGATFQIGPDVTTNQQIRVGIGSVNTAKLGGAAGRLFQLRSGQDADLSTNTKLADRIVGEAILSVATLRGRLGSIQRSTLDPTISALQNSLEALTEAEAGISNADFAQESSLLTRAQILVQAGAQTLQIANQFPQYAAMLIGG